ncbi:DUF2835 domain-containing protein [Pseudohongiella spirulinae]|uniref:Topoisomerase II n=1 Tax=Pseudohongiella spirulinae TaxID=1249552 RepID=A0A0S2KBE1_9GAMM|nr:DUF2835 domain-containing protein [Pseudohongiella spirulinae]ALO45632.1 hypothetical protein PS2015_963 [Pseudohongiella spirulinae]
MAQCLIFDLNITADQYLRHYQGQVNQVVCSTRDGRRIRFPSSVLQRFVTHDGVMGTFAISFDDNHKLTDIKRMA